MALIQVVKYNGGPDVFAWKFPSEELGTWSQLIVNESQEAILFKGGVALDLFPSGRHTLSTDNIPILNQIVNLPFGGKSPFTAEVWFINKAYSLDIKWGTASPIQLQDPKYKIFIPVRAFGQFGIQIEDSRKFLLKLVGTLSSFDKDVLTKFFKGIYLTKIKDAISSFLVQKQVSVLEINAYLEEISEALQEKMIPIFSEYGIKLVTFNVNDISVPEDDTAVKKLKDALAKRAEMDIVGYNYVQERSFDTLEGAAKNPGTSQAGFMGAGMGLGMGVGLGNTMGSQMYNMTQNINTSSPKKTCPSCNAELEQDKRFCGECGYDTQKKEEEKQDTVTCSNCGAKYSSNVKFCPECGDKYIPCSKCGADLKEDSATCPVCGASKPKPCSKCGHLIEDENTKFCPECGNSLIKKCTGCGTEIKGTPKFCPECGTSL